MVLEWFWIEIFRDSTIVLTSSFAISTAALTLLSPPPSSSTSSPFPFQLFSPLSTALFYFHLSSHLFPIPSFLLIVFFMVVVSDCTQDPVIIGFHSNLRFYFMHPKFSMKCLVLGRPAWVFWAIFLHRLVEKAIDLRWESRAWSGGDRCAGYRGRVSRASQVEAWCSAVTTAGLLATGRWRAPHDCFVLVVDGWGKGLGIAWGGPR